MKRNIIRKRVRVPDGQRFLNLLWILNDNMSIFHDIRGIVRAEFQEPKTMIHTLLSYKFACVELVSHMRGCICSQEKGIPVYEHRVHTHTGAKGQVFSEVLLGKKISVKKGRMNTEK